jgi:hypothetical protein
MSLMRASVRMQRKFYIPWDVHLTGPRGVHPEALDPPFRCREKFASDMSLMRASVRMQRKFCIRHVINASLRSDAEKTLHPEAWYRSAKVQRSAVRSVGGCASVDLHQSMHIYMITPPHISRIVVRVSCSEVLKAIPSGEWSHIPSAFTWGGLRTWSGV